MSFFADKLGPVPKPLRDTNSTGQPLPPEWAVQQNAAATPTVASQSQPVPPPPAAVAEPSKKKKGWF